MLSFSWLLCLATLVAAQILPTRFNEGPDDPFVDSNPIPPSPSQLPTLDGSAYPPYENLFIRGECDANDFGTQRINTNKTCFQCFRIPTMIKTNAPGAGTILAFAEARRADLGVGRCVDIPDTHLVYKRSADGGKTWSPLKVFLHGPGRIEDGTCEIQAAPVVDPDTNTIFVGFNKNGGCQGLQHYPYLVNSTDDGVTWSIPEKMIVNGRIVGTQTGPIIGPTKGLSVKGPMGQTRLMLPGEGGKFGAASIYSDDHGKTWHSNGTSAFGEMDWTVCTPGACGGRGKYAMVIRDRGFMSISFSNDTVHWSRKSATRTDLDVNVAIHHDKPGIVGIPGGLMVSHPLGQCPFGVRTCDRAPSDVIGSGMGLFVSKDGITWKLFKRIWPYGGMYSTLIPLTVDKDGGALTYAVIYTAGAIGFGTVAVINFQNFTFSPSDFDILNSQDDTVIV